MQSLARFLALTSAETRFDCQMSSFHMLNSGSLDLSGALKQVQDIFRLYSEYTQSRCVGICWIDNNRIVIGTNAVIGKLNVLQRYLG